MLKKITLLSVLLFFITSVWASLQDNLANAIKDVIPNVTTDTNDINYVVIAQELKFWLFAFVGIIAVAYILYVGAKLLWAPGNTEAITTSLKSL
jgi:threonine/homoserine/homoserine lactone efflux protein